jgi:hypothetical protein
VFCGHVPLHALASYSYKMLCLVLIYLIDDKQCFLCGNKANKSFVMCVIIQTETERSPNFA